MKGKDAERDMIPCVRFLGHAVKSCMTVINILMGCYPKLSIIRPVSTLPVFFIVKEVN